MNQIGYFGKTPHRGDFVRFNLPGTFVTVWDDWLQQLMLEGERKHENNWSTIYTTAPSYRFALSKGTVGEAAWAGILIPSVDKVGRRFPFCLAASLQENEHPANLLANPHSWYTSLVSLADLVNDPDYDFDNLQAELAELANSIKPAEKQSIETINGDYESDFIKIVADSSTTLNSNTGSSLLMDSILRQVAFQYSLWVTHTRTNEGVTYLTNGLPDTTDSMSLFDQRWNRSSGIFISGDIADDRDDRSTTTAPNALHRADLDTFNSDQTITQPIPQDADKKPAQIQQQQHDLTHRQPQSAEKLDHQTIMDTRLNPDTDTRDHIEEDDEVFTTGDWSDFVHSDKIKPAARPKPTVEKLEIEDDGDLDEPWGS